MLIRATCHQALVIQAINPKSFTPFPRCCPLFQLVLFLLLPLLLPFLLFSPVLCNPPLFETLPCIYRQLS